MKSKCRLDKSGYVVACLSLMTYHDEKNICLQAITEDGEAVRCFYTLNTDKRRGGVVMNYCPFCGENISSHITGEE